MSQLPVRRRRTDNEPPAPSPPPRKKSRKNHHIVCHLCKMLFSEQGLQLLDSPRGLTHHSPADLETWSEGGCPICACFRVVVQENFGRDWESGGHLIFHNVYPESMKDQRDTHKPALHALKCSLENIEEHTAAMLYPFTKNGNPLANLIPRRPLKRCVASQGVFAAAKKLADECLSTHDKHCRYSKDTMLPTRVLDVGQPGTDEPFVRLQSNESDTRGSYLALSYCWGKPDPSASPQPLLLKRHSFRDLERSISIHNLQQTIRDAILVTRKLGYRYLWVDALCIIQEESEDKAHEISRMATIYKNASITLAAGTAERAADGFLKTCPPGSSTYLPEYKFDIPMDNNKKPGNVYLSVEAYEPHHQLDKRAWTLQEYLLSSRMLIFSDYELLWQCKEVELQSVTGTLNGLEYRQPLESIPWTVFHEDAELDYRGSDSEIAYQWKTIIRQYTARGMSDPEDRLRAIAGVVSELETLLGDANVYGHWKKWFIDSLAWFKPPRDRVDRQCLTRAPSWSWVSLDGVIHYDDRVETEDARVKTLTTTSLVLECRILRDNDIDRDALTSIIEMPDLCNDVELKEANGDFEYVLLGKTGLNKGVGLLVLPLANHEYRRFGLAIFKDMSIWDSMEHQEVVFEGKAQ